MFSLVPLALAALACLVLDDAVAQNTDDSGAAPNTPKGVVMFFVDDMGYGDLGCFGAPTTATPHIDLMAAQGLKLTQWYSAAPLCTPSRAGLLTGRLPKRSGLCGGVFPCDASNGIPSNETTWPAVLQKAGWATAMVGKWHLGQRPQFRPTERGFDSYLGVPYSVDMGCSYHATTNHTNVCSGNITAHPCGGLPLLDGQAIVEQPTDLSTLSAKYTARILSHIHASSIAGRDWAAYYAFSHVHTPQFAGGEFAGRSRRGIFGDSVEEVDSAVGQVLDLIRELGLQETTLALLSSDNGAPAALSQWTNERQDKEPMPLTGINAPFTGTKWQVWEGGMRMPGIAWGGPVAGAARTALDVVASTDVYATVMDWAGLPRRSGRTPETIDDSISFMHLLTATGIRGYTGPAARSETFLYGGCGLSAVRVGAYKAMFGHPAPSQYHMYCNTGKPRPNGDDGEPWGTCVDVAAQNNTLKGGPLIFQIEHDPGERFPLRVNSSEYERVLLDINAAVVRHEASLVALPQLLPHKFDGASCCRDPAAAVCCRNSSKGSLPPCYCDAPTPASVQQQKTDDAVAQKTDNSGALPFTADEAAVDDWHFPAEEPEELAAAQVIYVDSLNAGAGTVSISLVGAPPGSRVTLAVGDAAMNWTLRSVIPATTEPVAAATAVLERNWARWGALVYLQEPGQEEVSAWRPCHVAAQNPCMFLRKGVGEIAQLKRPRYALTSHDKDYFVKATTSTNDYLKQIFVNSTADHEASFVSAARVLPPTLDYAMLKEVNAHSGFSVSPQGRVMAANFSIREKMLRGDSPRSPGGLVLFDPKDHLPFEWPRTNFSEMKSAILGRFSRAVTVAVFDAPTERGFELLAAPNPQRGIETQPYDRAELVLRLEATAGGKTAPAQYVAVESCSLCGSALYVPGVNCSEVAHAAKCGARPQLVRDITAARFYATVLDHTTQWQHFFHKANHSQTAAGRGPLDLQILGTTDGTRLVDTARSVISAGTSNFIGLRPNYGDGSVYWSVTSDDRGALPLQSFALNRALLLWGHHKQAADRFEYYFNVYVRNATGVTPRNEPGMNRELWDRTPGKIDYKNWGPDARSSWPKPYQKLAQDSDADYGRFLELWAETARAMEEEDPAWIQRTFITVTTMSRYLFSLHDNATRSRAVHPASGLIVGPAEHDTCKDRGAFFSINGWTWRGWVAVSRFLTDTAAVQDKAFEKLLNAHIGVLTADLKVSVQASLVKTEGGAALFLPPFAATGFQPYSVMIEKTRGHEPGNGCPDFAPLNCTAVAGSKCDCTGFAGGPTYAGFRYYSEMLSSGLLTAEVATAVNDYRETHTGTLSGMTRYEDHLDDMPASGYAHSAVSLKRTESFQALYFGHIANYQSRGVFNAPEQLSLYGDGVPGSPYFSDSFRAQVGSGEVDVDLCVPSTILPAIMARWMMLFDERDTDTIALFRAAPRRFFRPSTASEAAIVLERGPTRYGSVSANLTVASVASEPECSGSALLSVRLDMNGRGYVDKASGLTVEMRLRAHGGSCSAPRTLAAATLVGDVGPHRLVVDSATDTATLYLIAAPERGVHEFQVHGTFS